jgi:hypothetical protein
MASIVARNIDFCDCLIVVACSIYASQVANIHIQIIVLVRVATLAQKGQSLIRMVREILSSNHIYLMINLCV